MRRRRCRDRPSLHHRSRTAMYLSQRATSDHPEISRTAACLYFSLYVVLWLQHRVRRICQRLLVALRRLVIFAPAPAALVHAKPLRLQRHLAIAGDIAHYPLPLALLVARVVAAGTRHVTLYDHRHAVDADRIARALPCDGLTYQIAEIRIDDTRVTFLPRATHPCTGNPSPLLDHQPDPSVDVLLTIVYPGTGRASIARSARLLAERCAASATKPSPEDVIEWLDNDHAQCMLPSEPDTIVIFPPPNTPSVPVLNEFPVWQLRLSQIRFSPRSLLETSITEFAAMVASAADAPKRFGR